MRIYDPRIAKFLSVDPISDQYPELTPYQFASNRPIDGIDMDGLEHRSAVGIGDTQNGMELANLFLPKSKQLSPKELIKTSEAYHKGGAKGAVIGLASAGGIYYAPALMQWALTPHGSMQATGLLWGTLTDEDFPGGFDDVARGAKSYVLNIAEGSFETKAGLKYVFRQYAKGGENSLTHVLKHTRNDLTKNLHSIFDNNGTKLLEQLDDAFKQAKSINWDLNKGTETIGNVTRSVLSNGNTNYVIEMGVKVGIEGGKKGTGSALTKILISTEGILTM